MEYEYIEYKNKKGEYHRKARDGHAVIDGDRKEWYINGKLHREDGPAVIEGDRKEWFINGVKHREDGPAYIGDNGESWWLNGIRHRNIGEGPSAIWYDRKEWYINGKLHREDGPAFISGDRKYWYIKGIKREEEWVKKYLKIKNKHTLLGVIVSDKSKIREIILRWRYNPVFKCVQNRLKREFDSL